MELCLLNHVSLILVIVDGQPAMAYLRPDHGLWAQRLTHATFSAHSFDPRQVIGGGNGDRVGKLQDALVDSRMRGGARGVREVREWLKNG